MNRTIIYHIDGASQGLKISAFLCFSRQKKNSEQAAKRKMAASVMPEMKSFVERYFWMAVTVPKAGGWVMPL